MPEEVSRAPGRPRKEVKKKTGRPRKRKCRAKPVTLPRGIGNIPAELIITASEVILEVHNVLLFAPIPPNEVVIPRGLCWAALRKYSGKTINQIAETWGQENRTVQYWLRKMSRALNRDTKEGVNIEWRDKLQEIRKLAISLNKLAKISAKKEKKRLPKRNRGEFLFDYKERCRIWKEEQAVLNKHNY